MKYVASIRVGAMKYVASIRGGYEICCFNKGGDEMILLEK
jgi:hypothetical protein